MNPILIALLLALLVFQGWVTRKIWNCSAYDGEQKAAQTRFIWLVPLLGAVVAYVIYLDANPSVGGTQSSEERRDGR